MLHEQTAGLVELAAGRRRDGRLQITTTAAKRSLPARRRRQRSKGGLTALLELAERHAAAGRGGVRRSRRAVGAARGEKQAVSETRFLWVDVDRPGQLHALWAFLAERPCHLLIESGGSGGCHAYFRLAEPLPAGRVVAATGELVEPIERANLRIIHRLGIGENGRPSVADPACAERSRLMRLAGSVNGKTGAYARIVEADFALAPYPIAQLVGDLPDPIGHAAQRPRRPGNSTDPYKGISPPEYFEKLAGIVVPRDGLVSCPAPDHDDRNPSCSVGTSPETGWCCHSGCCGARGAIYDLASVLLGGPWGHELRGEAFNRAREYVADVCGELGRNQPRDGDRPAR